jgi:hypothetical protein
VRIYGRYLQLSIDCFQSVWIVSYELVVSRGKALGIIAVHFSLFLKRNVSKSGANYADMSKSELSSFYNFKRRSSVYENDECLLSGNVSVENLSLTSIWSGSGYLGIFYSS